jgi:hypothetical protein
VQFSTSTIISSVTLQSKSGQGRLVLRFLDHTQLDTHKQTNTHTHTHSRTLLNEWSARRRGRYLHNKHKRRTYTSSAEFEPTIQEIKRLQPYALDGRATRIHFSEPFFTVGFSILQITLDRFVDYLLFRSRRHTLPTTGSVVYFVTTNYYCLTSHEPQPHDSDLRCRVAL